MKKAVPILLLGAFLLTASGCAPAEDAIQTHAVVQTEAVIAELPIPETFPTEPEAVELIAPQLELTNEEKEMLLKIGMAERGSCGCPECIALIMRTVLNRVESGRFGSSLRSVLFSPNQFTPVATGYYYKVKPNELCYDALEMVIYGWDESQGALYYEWCEGESWHSQNLNLLFQHCNIRFYD